jgi:type IV secretory pathway TrbD component
VSTEAFLALILLADIALASIPGFIARSKGYSFLAFLAFGFFLWPVAIVVAVVLGRRTPAPENEHDLTRDAGDDPQHV